MLHLAKLAVGARDIAHLRQSQAARLLSDPPLRHRTRHMPRRAAEITEGGSLYWVVAGVMQARQRITTVIEDHWEDGSRCCGLLLDPEVVQVEGRPVKAFQGWRYLEAGDAPRDLSATDCGPDALPPMLRNELRMLCLI